MSSLLRVSFVCEGVTDFLVLDALVDSFLAGRDYIPNRIQPPQSAYANDAGPLGGGWKGVLRWCENESAEPGGFGKSTSILNCDCLVIHIDADIAVEAELAEFDLAAACPPARETCDLVRNHLAALLTEPLPSKVVLCIPAQCTEAWVVSALHPDVAAKVQPSEWRNEVERLLIGKPDRLVRDKDGAAKKQAQKYRESLDSIVTGWPNATTICPEAERFELECQEVLNGIEA